MKLGFLMFFFLIFNAYIMLISIFYLNIEPLFLWLKQHSIHKSIFLFRWILEKTKKKGRLTLFTYLYLLFLFRRSEKIVAFYQTEQEFSEETKRLFEPVYTKVLHSKFRRFKKLDVSEQILILRSIPNLGFVNEEIKKFLWKVMDSNDLFLRSTALHSIIQLNRKEYFIDSLLYISNHHLSVNTEFFSPLILLAYQTMDELTMEDLIENWPKFSRELKCCALTALEPYYNEQHKYVEEINRFYLAEEDYYVRIYFYKNFHLKMNPEMKQLFLKDLNNRHDDLRMAAVSFADEFYDEEIEAALLDRLFHGTNVDLLYEEAMVLVHHDGINEELFWSHKKDIREYELLRGLLNRIVPEKRWYSWS